MINVLEVKNLTVQVETGKKILQNISFKIENNSVYVLIGPNGSGKSTLAYVLMGLPRYKVVSGKIFFQGKDITKLAVDKRAKMGLCLGWQEPVYLEGIKVLDFIKAGAEKVSLKKIEESLSLVGLDSSILGRVLDRSLSGGERKRIELASLIVLNPKLMILDEPDAGLDIIIYREFYNILENIKKQTKTAILLITHREEIGFMASQAIFLNQGRIICQGNFNEVMKKYCETSQRKKICQKATCPKNF